MRLEETNLQGCYVITPKVFEDNRGYFYESFNHRVFTEKTGSDITFVQDNQSKSSKGVLRGMHFQTGEYAQSKLVRVISGSVLDVCVDIRPDSASFGKYFAIKLDALDHKQLFVPRGFAHGFLSLENDTIFSYKCDNYYNKNSECGILYNDPSINIDWEFREDQLILSEKDLILPLLKNLKL